jgi:hypothetical protein
LLGSAGAGRNREEALYFPQTEYDASSLFRIVTKTPSPGKGAGWKRIGRRAIAMSTRATLEWFDVRPVQSHLQYTIRDNMKRYRIEFAFGPLGSIAAIAVITAFCLSVIGLPFAIVILPTMYRIVEEWNESVG